MREIKPNDIVNLKHNAFNEKKTGKVVAISSNHYLVQLDNYTGGHDGWEPHLKYIGTLPPRGSKNCRWFGKELLTLSKEHRFKELIDLYEKSRSL